MPTTPTYDSLQPTEVWQLFAGLSRVPRPSKKEQAVRSHVSQVAEAANLKCTEDEAGNLIVRVPASSGFENAPIVILQAHLDMVCEQNDGTGHDFDHDPIRLIVDFDSSHQPIVRADGTTLGADNGIGVCLALAAALNSYVTHGPLELLFTIDEEQGMSGAEGLDGSLLHGRQLLNLDTEEDDAIYIGCAGGCDSILSWRAPLETLLGSHGPQHRVIIRGLRGGHSGGDIHEGRGSATRLLARLLEAVDAPLAICQLSGGRQLNAIAREARAVVSGPTRRQLERAAEHIRAAAQSESDEPDLEIVIDAVSEPLAGASPASSRRWLNALLALPHGVLGMHPKLSGLVETSNNVAQFNCQRDEESLELTVALSSRSSSASRLQETLDQIAAIGALSGAEVRTANAYPGWQPDFDSSLLAICSQVMAERIGKEPKVAAVHAGLECGLLGERCPGLDMVSIGPRIEGAHSPDERVWVASVQQSWDDLRAILNELARRDA